MTIEKLSIGEPFFTLRLIRNEDIYQVNNKTIILNLADRPLGIQEQTLETLESLIALNTEINQIDHAIVVEDFSDHPDEDALFDAVRGVWPSAYEVRGEDRLKGIGHYMSPKVWIDGFGFTLYHAATVPLKVGLHRDHAFCPVPGFREVHMQIVGIGKMQQCREQSIDTLYLEEPMAPGATHKPMYDEHGNYPWHQYETITPSIFLAVEMLPEGASPPQL